MIVLGLTGSIGAGKSTTAGFFRDEGVPVHDSDATVHRLYRGPLAQEVEAAFPGTTGPDGVDRAALGRAVLGDAAAIRRLEAIVHPPVREAEARFLARSRAEGVRVVVLDIPLLFETGAERRCDAVVVATVDPDVQRERVLARPDMTADKLDAILARQTPDAEKRRRGHFLVDSGRGLASARAQVRSILRAVNGAA